MLAHRSIPDLEAAGLRLMLNHNAVVVDPSQRIVKIEIANRR